MTAKKYNGHRSWNAWNVALWIGNDESLYKLALDCLKRTNRNGRGNVNGTDQYDAMFVAETQHILEGWISRSAKEVPSVQH